MQYRKQNFSRDSLDDTTSIRQICQTFPPSKFCAIRYMHSYIAEIKIMTLILLFSVNNTFHLIFLTSYSCTHSIPYTKIFDGEKIGKFDKSWIIWQNFSRQYSQIHWKWLIRQVFPHEYLLPVWFAKIFPFPVYHTRYTHSVYASCTWINTILSLTIVGRCL